MTEQHKDKFFHKDNLPYLLFSTCITLLMGRLMEPIFSYLFSKLLGTGGTIVNWMANFTYRQISNGYSEQTAFLILSFLVILAFIAAAQMLTELKNVYEKYVTYCNCLVAEPIPNKKTCPESHQESLEAQKEFILGTLKKAKIFYIVGNISIAFTLCYVLFSYGQISYVNSRISVLTSNIEIVSPYISDLEYKHLKSNFHAMENRDDYNNLISELEVLGKNYSLKLKK